MFKTTNCVKVVDATWQHLDAILHLAKQQPRPWSDAAWQAELSCGYARVWGALPQAAAATDTSLIGVLVAWHIVDELQILNIVVDKRLRNQGIGCVLLKHAIDIAQKAGLQRLWLEVGCRNLAAQALYQKLGFYRVSCRKDYYPAYLNKDTWVAAEDAWCLQKDL